jgi:tetratricopeptide (TPR) repeat protein
LYQPHILSLHSVYKESVPRPVAPIGFAELLSDAVYYFWERGTLADSSKLTDTAEEICDKYPQASYVTKANVYSLGAVLRWSRGITQRAPILRRFLTALALLQKHVNELNPDEATPGVLRLYATSWNDVAHIFMEHEFYEDAIRCLDLCAAIKRGLGDELGVWGANRNKALALAWLGRFSEASKLIPDEEKILPELLASRCASYYERCRFAWANILIMIGDLKRAHDLLQKNLNSRKLLCGETGYYTLDSYYLLGITHRKMGNTQEAMYSDTCSHVAIANHPIRNNFKRALEDSTDWSEESKSLAKYHLSKALADIGQHEEAQNLSEEADAVRRRLWDPYATYLNVQGGNDDETYDHLASSEMGRTTIGKFQASGKLPKLMKICKDMQERLNALGRGQILPSTCCKVCKSPEINISEAEIY